MPHARGEKKLANPTPYKRALGISMVPKTMLNINGVCMRALIDSGSSLTIIKASSANELAKQGSIIEPCQKTIKTITDSRRKIESRMKIRVSTDEGDVEVYAYIINTSGFSGQLLLGSDAMEKLHATIDYQRMGVVIAGKLHPFTNRTVDAESTMAISENQVTESIGRVLTDVRVLAGTAVVIQVQTSAYLEGRTVVMVPFVRYDGVAASTICVVKNHCVHVVYANLDDRPVTLRGGTRMARICELHEEAEDETVLLCNSSESIREQADA